MSALIPFENAKLPAYLEETADRGNELDAGGLGFPVLSYKGKVWAIKRSGERTTIMRPDDEETPASTLDVVILRAGPGVSKVFYSSRYTENSDDAPNCFSNDGITPSSQAEDPQAETCATCPHNVFGTAVGEDGAGKGKRCGDFKRLAIAAAGTLNDPMLLRIPPASLKNLTEFSKLLRTRGVKDPAVVVTRLSFDHDAATPKVKFRPVGFLPEESYREAQSMYDDPVTQEIVGLLGDAPVSDTSGTAEPPKKAPAKKTAAKPKPAPAEEEEELHEEEEEEVTPPPKKAPAKKAPAKKAAAKKASTQTSMFDSGVEEEEEEPAPPKPATRKAAPKQASVEVPSGLEAELDDILGQFDD